MDEHAQLAHGGVRVRDRRQRVHDTAQEPEADLHLRGELVATHPCACEESVNLKVLTRSFDPNACGSHFVDQFDTNACKDVYCQNIRRMRESFALQALIRR